MGDTTLQRWVEQLASERVGMTPVGRKALTPDQQRIQVLEAKIQWIERARYKTDWMPSETYGTFTQTMSVSPKSPEE